MKPPLKPANRKHRLQQLLSHPSIWQARHSQAALCPSPNEHGLHQAAVKTGFPQIDQRLQAGGWPTTGLIECLHEQAAQGELYLFMPALKQLAQEASRSPVILIAPPYLPYSTAWQQYGINCQQLWVLSPGSADELLWAAEQVLNSGCCAAVFIWLQQNPKQQLDWKQLRKLQLAAQRSPGLAIFFRDGCFRQHSSPASLRLSLSTDATATANNGYSSRLSVDIIKQPGYWGGQQVSVPWHKTLQNARMPASEWPVHIPAPRSPGPADRFGPEWISAKPAPPQYS